MQRSRLVTVLVAAACVLVPAPAAAAAQPAPTVQPPPAPAPPGVPAPGEVVSSPNVRQIANVPPAAPFDPARFVGTDIAFQDGIAYVGNYDGFTVYDVEEPAQPRVVSRVLCPGPQNDVSVSGDLLFLSTDSRMSGDSCGAPPAVPAGPVWEGIKVFDVSDPAVPQYVTSVATDCGSHTHTLLPGDDSDILYVSSYGPSPELSGCRPPHDKISIVEVPHDDPAAAAVVATPVLFPDGGNPGPGSDTTSGCHDITVFPSQDLAAGACMGDGILMDISEPTAPRVIERVSDQENFAFWHSATFNNDATKVVFTDELGGGGAATCNTATGPTRGADGVYDIVGEGDDRRLEFRSYFKIPRMQADTENCVAHNGSLIPVQGRDLMVQAWYQGGVSIWDFTDSSKPVEIGYWERGPVSAAALVTGGSWSAYWYDGAIFSSDITRGLDVLQVDDPRVDPALDVRYEGPFNPQTQPVY